MITNKAQFKFKVGTAGIADRGGVARIRNRDDNIGISRALQGQIFAELAANFVNIFIKSSQK